MKRKKPSKRWIPTKVARGWDIPSFEIILPELLPPTLVSLVSMYLYQCGLSVTLCTNPKERHILCSDCSEIYCPNNEEGWVDCAADCGRIIHRNCSNPLRKCAACKDTLDVCALHVITRLCSFGHAICEDCGHECSSCKRRMCWFYCVGRCGWSHFQDYQCCKCQAENDRGQKLNCHSCCCNCN